MSTARSLGGIPDRELAARYWAARDELASLRRPRRAAGSVPSGDELASAFQRIRALAAVCEQLWRESRRRTQAGSLSAAS